MHKVWRLVCALLTIAMCACSLTQSAWAAQVASAPLTNASAAQNGMVRVLLSSMNYPASLDVTVKGSYTAEGSARVVLSSGDRVHVQMNKSTGQITLTCGGLTYDMGREVNLRRHQTNGQSGLMIAQSKMPDNLYPGDLQLKAQLSGGTYRLYPVVHVYIEYYLHGVVPYEMGNSAHLEALKAQAVAARTYTLNKMNVRAAALYDVVDTTNDQVYYGNSDSTTRCTQAVNDTKGIVLMNNGKLTGTYYTASNGGQTESAANLWGSAGYDYLTVKDDPFDRMNTASVLRKVTVYEDNQHMNQNPALKNLLQNKLTSVLAEHGYSTSGISVTKIHAITPHTPKYGSPSRLYTKMDFEVSASTASGNMNATLSFDIFSELETALGMSINTSDNELWSVEKNGNVYTIYARRFGHGIGMSQRGAMQMGSMGYTYDQILGFYYEGCQRVRYSFTHTILSSVESGGTDTIITTEKPAEITGNSGVTALVKLVGVSDKLVIRDAASDSGTILTSIINGGLVNVLAKMDSWTMIRLGNIVGYVPTSALRFNGEAPQATDQTPTRITQWATVQCSGTLNLRDDASMNSSVITRIPSGSVMCVFTQRDGWAQVQYGASSGWCSTDFLKMSSSYPGQVTGEISGAAAVSIPSGSGTVNLRESPSTTARILKALSNGTQVTVNTSDGSWCHVTTSDGTKGYIMATYVAFGGDEEDAPSDAPDHTPDLEGNELEAVVHTASTSLNLRQQPNTQSPVLASLPRGESIVVTDRGATWSAVRYGNLNGYVMSMYLRFPSDEESGDAILRYAEVHTQTGSLNMRKQPSLGSAVLLQIPRGTRIGILQELDGWCKVTYAGINGYVMSSYLSSDGESTPEGANQQATVVTPSGTLNLRQSPASTAGVLTTISPGTRVKVISRGSEWCKINHNGTVGYVMTKFLSFQDESAGESIPAGSMIKVRTNNGGLNLRETASASARVLLIIPDGTALTCLAYGAEWSQVRYGENTGYVMSKFLDVSGVGLNQMPGIDQQPNNGASVRVATGGGGLNLRQSAGTDALVLTSIPDGATIVLLSRESSWSKVRYQGMEGYVMNKYLALDDGSTDDEKTAWIVADITGGVNLRFMPDTSGKVLAVLNPGTQITVTLSGENWSVVRYDDQTGYVMSKYITYAQSHVDTGNEPQPVYDPTMYTISGWEAEVVPDEGNVNLRAWCATSAPVRVAMPKGSVVRLIEYGDTWCHIAYGEVEGYCMTQFLAPREMQ